MSTMVNTQQAWDNILVGIQSSVSRPNFNSWFRQTFIIKIDKGTVVIGVPDAFTLDWLQNKYHKIILKSVREVFPETRSLEFVVSKKKEDQSTPLLSVSQSFNSNISQNNSQELPLSQYYVNKKTNLNDRYDFDSFIIGSFNELAYSAAQAIIQKPGVYNPFYIYGETGIGKTHLIQSIGNALYKQNPNLNIFYINSEKFTQDLVSALQRNRVDAFKSKYRALDVLIIDDIQFISGKDKTQEELFHLFNVLYDQGKQIVFSSDKHPNYIIGLEERLVSRFSAGMIVDMGKPEYESRIAIINSKLKELQYTLNTTAIEYIAKNVEGNVRELEGILNSLMCQTKISDAPLTLEIVKDAVKNNVKSRKQVSVEDVARVVSQFYNINHNLIYDKTRRKEVVHSRQIIMYILREDFNISFPHIGRELGGRDHTTVIHSCSKIKEELEENPHLIQELEQIRSMLQTY